MPRRHWVERLSPHQERLLAAAAAEVPSPFRSGFLADVRSRLGEWPSDTAVITALDVSLAWFAARRTAAREQQASP
jgi:hypothetical protein